MGKGSTLEPLGEMQLTVQFRGLKAGIIHAFSGYEDRLQAEIERQAKILEPQLEAMVGEEIGKVLRESIKDCVSTSLKKMTWDPDFQAAIKASVVKALTKPDTP